MALCGAARGSKKGCWGERAFTVQEVRAALRSRATRTWAAAGYPRFARPHAAQMPSAPNRGSIPQRPTRRPNRNRPRPARTTSTTRNHRPAPLRGERSTDPRDRSHMCPVEVPDLTAPRSAGPWRPSPTPAPAPGTTQPFGPPPDIAPFSAKELCTRNLHGGPNLFPAAHAPLVGRPAGRRNMGRSVACPGYTHLTARPNRGGLLPPQPQCLPTPWGCFGPRDFRAALLPLAAALGRDRRPIPLPVLAGPRKVPRYPPLGPRQRHTSELPSASLRETIPNFRSIAPFPGIRETNLLDLAVWPGRRVRMHGPQTLSMTSAEEIVPLEYHGVCAFVPPNASLGPAVTPNGPSSINMAAPQKKEIPWTFCRASPVWPKDKRSTCVRGSHL